MFKKLSLCLSLLVFLGFGATQLIGGYACPGQLIMDQACCPDTYQGGTFLYAVDHCAYVKCHYINATLPYTNVNCT